MVLEATVIVLDNSEFMRNGDFTPTRAEAQSDAVNLLATTKTGANPESAVAIMTSAGGRPDVLLTLTQDLGAVLTALNQVALGGKQDFLTAIRVASLILKHRQSKTQRQRIVIFVGSPVNGDEKDLVTLAKQLKKNNIAVDIVNFGEDQVNTPKLDAFVRAINNNDNSHLITVQPGPSILSDMLISSPLFFEAEGAASDMAGAAGAGEGGAAAAVAAGGGAAAGRAAFLGGVDPNLDPELAMVLQMSLQEEEERRRREAAEASSKSDGAPPSVPPATPADASAITAEPTPMDEDAALAEAMRLSLLQSTPASATTTTTAPQAASTPSAPTTQTGGGAVDEDEEAMRLAMEMSMQMDSASGGAGAGAGAGGASGGGVDDVAAILSSLPGVDPNDPRIQELLQNLQQQKGGGGGGGDSSKK